MGKFYVVYNLKQVGSSEHHPWVMSSGGIVEAASIEEAVQKFYEDESGKSFSEYDRYIETVEGLYVLEDVEVTEDFDKDQPKFWVASIADDGKIVIAKREGR